MKDFTCKLPDWQQEIVDKYPKIYKEPNPELACYYKPEGVAELVSDPNFSNLRYGFEFGPGWKDLAVELSEVASGIIETLGEPYYIKSFIFKEKFERLEWQGDDNLPAPLKMLWNLYTEDLRRRSSLIDSQTGERLKTPKFNFEGNNMKILLENNE